MPILRMYRTVLNTRPLMFQETRTIARLRLDGQGREEILKQVMNDNLFQLSSRRRRRSFFYEIWRRLNLADQFLLSVIARGQADEIKQSIFFLLLQVDKLLAEFMREVWLDKYQREDFQLIAFDFSRFFKTKAEQSEQVRTWSESTIKHLKSAYQQVMYQAGFITSKRLPSELVAPLLSPALDQYFREHEHKQLTVLMRGGI